MSLQVIMFIVWASIAIVALIIEINTLELIGFSAIIGSIFAAITNSFTSANFLWVQIVVFVFVWTSLWILLFIFYRKKRKVLHDQNDGYLKFLGQEHIAVQGNKKGYGKIVINDKHFRFKSSQKIDDGNLVKVLEIKGVTMIVKKVGK